MRSVAPSAVHIRDTTPWYSQRWPWLLMLGPGVVVVAALYTGWLAFSRQDAMVVDDYYKQGMAINKDLRRDSVASAEGLTFNGRYDPSAGKLNGTLLSFGKPISGKILIHLAHPTQPEKDIQLTAQSNKDGHFSVELPMLERTIWQVVVRSDRGDWRLTGTWKWPQHMLDLRAPLLPAEG